MAQVTIDPLAGQIVGQRDGHGDHDPYSATALKSLGGKFELIEATRGVAFTETDLLGKWALVYFGYMECSEACPIALKAMPAAVDRLNAEGIPTQAVFIDINAPRLDDLTGGMAHGGSHGGTQVGQSASHRHDGELMTGPEMRRLAIAAWGPKSNPEMIFLSGTRKQVVAATRAFQSRVEPAMMKNEEPIHHINHTTTIYLQDPLGRVAGLVYHSDPVATMVDAVKALASKQSTSSVASENKVPAGVLAAAPQSTNH